MDYKLNKMGSEIFYIKRKGTKSRDLFINAREDAIMENGNSGYTGTIAEKSDYTMSKKPSEIDADKWIEMIEDFNEEEDKEKEYYEELKSDYEIYDDKWEDALCIPIDGGFIFCGFASS